MGDGVCPRNRQNDEGEGFTKGRESNESGGWGNRGGAGAGLGLT
ncbi:MAG: hypothetical protein JWR69_4227 [Pedosphaera sp.]|nr:hypothetical protein [Pedosphaera sp.]